MGCMELAEQIYLHSMNGKLVCCNCRNLPPALLAQHFTYKRKIMSFHCNKKNRIERATHRIAGRQEKWKKSEDENLKRHFHIQYYHFRSTSNRVLYLGSSPQPRDGTLRPSFSISVHCLQVNCSVCMSWIGTVKALPTPIIRMSTHIGPFLMDRARLWHILGVRIFNGYLKLVTWVAKIPDTVYCDDDGCMRTQNIPDRLTCSSNNLTIHSAAEKVGHLPDSERMRRNIEATWQESGNSPRAVWTFDAT